MARIMLISYVMSVYTIIGDGIAARTLAFYLSQNLDKEDEIIQIFSNDFAPKCSDNTTAINSLRGTKLGITPLGDLIVNSYHSFENFFEEFSPSGITLGSELNFCHKNSDKRMHFEKRFSFFETNGRNEFCHFKMQDYIYAQYKAYFIAPSLFLDWLEMKAQVRKISDFIIGLEYKSNEWILSGHSKTEYRSDFVFLCTSNGTKLFSSVMDDSVTNLLEDSKPVSGSYYELDSCEVLDKKFNLDKSFSLDIQGAHFIFRKQDHKFLIAATSQSDDSILLPQYEALLLNIQKIEQAFGFKLQIEKSACVKTGIRHKGKQRKPFWGKVGKNLYGMWGLYKNGFTYSFLASEDILFQLKKGSL